MKRLNNNIQKTLTQIVFYDPLYSYMYAHITFETSIIRAFSIQA